jgi:hypothetical protein
MDLNTLREFFGWMTLVNLVLYTSSALMCMFGKGWIQRIHGKRFGLAPDAINAFLYGYLGVYKVAFIVFNFVPWLALVIMTR